MGMVGFLCAIFVYTFTRRRLQPQRISSECPSTAYQR